MTSDDVSKENSMNFEIKNRFSGAVMFSCELSAEIAGRSYGLKLGFAVRKAIEARAYLAGAYLAGANLAGANLAGAYLARADLARADLADAYLADAYLADADLARADLAGAYLAGAYLARAYLAGANLAGADLARAYLAGANLAGADLARADLAGAYLAGAKNIPETNGSESIQQAPADRRARQQERAARFRERFPDVPVVEHLDATIVALVESGQGKLDMSSWHTCETTHCRAGWAVQLAGEAGKELDSRFGTEDAGRRIYLASTGRVPWFFDSNEGALADMKEQAALLADAS
jgi:uncharacterized protein YjbI with pentapeptide repeats